MANDAYLNGQRAEMQRLRQWAFEPPPRRFARWRFDLRYFMITEDRGPLLSVMDDFGTLQRVAFQSDAQNSC